jgi:DNA-binding MarR family transcriptional regulator
MGESITELEFQALAELRYRIRKFIQAGDTAARQIGLEPQQYLLLLALRGLPPGSEASIRTLAERLSLQHHSAVELVDRMEQHGYVKRARSTTDRRQVLVCLQSRGEKLLQKVAGKRLVELRSTGHELVAAISALLEPEPGNNHHSGTRKTSHG